MSAIPQLRLSHMGMFVRDLERMAQFYKDVLGFMETDRSPPREFQVIFLSRSPSAHHQLVLSSGRPESSGRTDGLQQLSFKVGALADLRTMQKIVSTRDDVSDIHSVDHGNSWSLYFRDPEENRIEIYLDTPWNVAQPHRVDLDLSMSDDEILRTTGERLGSDPTCQPREEWQRAQAEKMRAAGLIAD